MAVLYIYSGLYPAQLIRHLSLTCLMKYSFLTGFLNYLCSHQGEENVSRDIQRIELSPNTVSVHKHWLTGFFFNHHSH